MLICHMGNTSEKILQTTFELLAERGYANISMRLIAKKAGVAVSQLTYYYRTKENLISSVIDAVIERSEDALQQRLRSGKLPPAAIFADFFSHLSENESLVRVALDFSAQALWVPTFREKIDRLYNRLSSMIEKHLFDSQKVIVTPDGRAIPIHALARILLGSLFGISSQITLGMDETVVGESLSYAKHFLSPSSLSLFFKESSLDEN